MNNAPVNMQRNPGVQSLPTQGYNSQGQINNAPGQMYQGPKPPYPAAPSQYGAPPPQQYGAPPPQQYGAPPPQQPGFNPSTQFNMAPPQPNAYNSAPPYASAPPAYGGQYGAQQPYGNPPLQNFQTQRPNIPPGAAGYVGSVSLQKGGNMSLSKANPNLVKVRIGK